MSEDKEQLIEKLFNENKSLKESNYFLLERIEQLEKIILQNNNNNLNSNNDSFEKQNELVGEKKIKKKTSFFDK
jgi:hypothetical protein